MLIKEDIRKLNLLAIGPIGEHSEEEKKSTKKPKLEVKEESKSVLVDDNRDITNNLSTSTSMIRTVNNDSMQVSLDYSFIYHVQEYLRNRRQGN